MKAVRTARALVILASLHAASCEESRTEPAKRPAAPPVAAPSQPPAQKCSETFREMAPGLHHRMLPCDSGQARLHVVKVDLDAWSLDAVATPPATAPEIARTHAAGFVINANFFDEMRRPLGLVVTSGKVLQRPHPVSWESIFLIREGKPSIIPPGEWPDAADGTTMAVQAGPRLVIAGERNRVKRGEPSFRSGVCLSKTGEITFFATAEGSFFDVHELVSLAAEPDGPRGLGCHDAMLFDGGPSAQLFVSGGGQTVSIPGDDVPLFIVGRSRTSG